MITPPYLKIIMAFSYLSFPKILSSFITHLAPMKDLMTKFTHNDLFPHILQLISFSSPLLKFKPI